MPQGQLPAQLQNRSVSQIEDKAITVSAVLPSVPGQNAVHDW